MLAASSSEPEDAQELRPTKARGYSILAALALVALVMGIGPSLGGELGQVAAGGLVTTGLLVLLAGLWQASRVWPRTRLLAWSWFWLLMLLVALSTVVLNLWLAVAPGGDLEAALGQRQTERLLTGSGLMMLMLVAAVGLMISGRWFIVGRWLGGRLDRSEPAHA